MKTVDIKAANNEGSPVLIIFTKQKNINKVQRETLFTSITFAMSVIVLALSINFRWSIFTFLNLKMKKFINKTKQIQYPIQLIPSEDLFQTKNRRFWKS